MKNNNIDLNEIRKVVKDLIREEYIINDILSEGIFEDIMKKVKEYGKKGILTGAILTGLMSSPTFSQMSPKEQEAIKDTAKKEMSQEFKYLEDEFQNKDWLKLKDSLKIAPNFKPFDISDQIQKNNPDAKMISPIENGKIYWKNKGYNLAVETKGKGDSIDVNIIFNANRDRSKIPVVEKIMDDLGVRDRSFEINDYEDNNEGAGARVKLKDVNLATKLINSILTVMFQ